MNFIDERNERTRKRKKAKAAFDKAINLSVLNEKRDTYNLSAKYDNGDVRLLDEGAIVTANGDLDIFIMRGVIEKYLNGANTQLKKQDGELMNLTDDYRGSINIGHLPFAEFPVGIVGEWTREDFTAVDIGDDRKGLDVNMQVNSEHPLIRALEVQGIPVGVSVEMYLHFDEKLSEEKGAPMVDEIFISDFAIVGECGNVGSSETVVCSSDTETPTIEAQTVETAAVLQGVEMDEEKTVEAVEEETPEEETVEVEETEEAEEAEAEETEAEETEVETEEESEEDTEEDVEEESTDEADSESESEEDADEEDSSNEVLEALDSMKKQIESLNEQIDALKKTNRKLNKKLKAKNEADEKFMEKFKGLSISLGEQKEEEKEVTFTPYATGDGKGVL